MSKQQDLLKSYVQLRRYWRRWFACGLAVFLCGLSLLTMRVLSWIETRTRQDNINALRTLLATTHFSTNLWRDNLHRLTEMWGEHPDTIKLIQALKLSDTGSPAALKSHPSQKAIQSILRQRSRHTILHNPQIVGVDGTIWAALDETRIGDKHLVTTRFPDIWDQVRKGNKRTTHPVPSPYSLKINDDREHQENPTMFLLSPVLGSDGDPIAVMVYSIDPYEEFIPIMQAGRIGHTGEIYAIDKSGRFVSPSRFTEDLYHFGLIDRDEPIIFNLEARNPGSPMSEGLLKSGQRGTWPLTEAASSAIKREKGQSPTGIRDYRGIRVLSAWQWDEHLEIALIAEINEQEALASYEQTRFAIVIFLGTVLILLGVIVYVLNRSVGITKSNELAVQAIRLAKSNEEKFQSIFENVVEGIVCIDAQGFILEFNEAAERIFGFQAAETIGNNVSMLMPEPDKSKHDQYLHHYRQTGVKHIMGGYREVVGQRKDGGTFNMELALGEFKDADKSFFVGLVRDISERKETERLLITAREKAEHANQAKNLFLSRMSHELRTPLNGILGFSTLLSMDQHLSPKNKENVERIQRSGKHLLTMINEIMDISNLERHRKELQVEQVPLKSVFDEVTKEMNSLAVEKSVRIHVEKLPNDELAVWAHRKHLAQVVKNLISNGIKYNKPNGSLTIITESLSKDRVRIRILDTGIGIPESKIERLFSPFDRLDAEREQTHTEGSGLGLTLTKSLIEAMKGSISVTSKVGQGTEFSIELASAT